MSMIKPTSCVAPLDHGGLIHGRLDDLHPSLHKEYKRRRRSALLTIDHRNNAPSPPAVVIPAPSSSTAVAISIKPAESFQTSSCTAIAVTAPPPCHPAVASFSSESYQVQERGAATAAPASHHGHGASTSSGPGLVLRLPHCKITSNERDPVDALNSLKNASVFSPLPIRPSSSSPPIIKVLFDREYDALVEWQRQLFRTFTDEIQRLFGRTLRKYMREYQASRLAGDHHRGHNSAASGDALHAHAGQGQEDNSANIAGQDSHDSTRQSVTNGGSQSKLLQAYTQAREAIISIREVSWRIAHHSAWIDSDLSRTRLELLNLRYARGSPHLVLREVMELANAIRSFILEITSAIERNDQGVPWPLARKADCSDVTPSFVENLAQSMTPAGEGEERPAVDAKAKSAVSGDEDNNGTPVS